MTSVLVVDDEELVRFGFQLVLSASPDIDIVHTRGGHEASAAAELHGADVVLLDAVLVLAGGSTDG